MRIVIDLQGSQTESRFRGIGRYSTALAQAILRRAGSHDIWLALNAQLGESVDAVYANFRGLMQESRIVQFRALQPTSWIDPDNAWRRDMAALTREAFLAGIQPDIVHVSSLFEGSQDNAVASIGKLRNDSPTAVTLYDLIPLLNRREYLGTGWAHDWYMDRIASLRRADVLLAISAHARTEAIAALDLDGDAVVNISSAISDHFIPTRCGPAERAWLDTRFGLYQPYVMYSGAIEPRKNVDRLIEAFAVLPAEVRETHQLVVSGRVLPPERERLLQLAARVGVSNRLILTDYVKEEELLALYSGCALYVFPSLHEGFGLPALEAMACGVPTIGSSTTSIPEVIGRKDALFDPTNVHEIASAITKGLTDRDFNESLRKHAPLQAAKFSWDETARRAVDAFERIHALRGHIRIHSWSQRWAARNVQYDALISGIAEQTIEEAADGPSEEELPELAAIIADNQLLTDRVLRTYALPLKIDWRVEGPFDSTYSLALLNRETALALDRLGNYVALHSTEGPGDFKANDVFLAANPDVGVLHDRVASITPVEADVSSRLLYPPRVSDMASRINVLHHYAWEESCFPAAWVNQFNDSLQGMTLLSKHVEKIMIDNGVDIPMALSGTGVDHWERIVADKNYIVRGKAFRFLHVSSCFPRKGADLLIRAFGEIFSSADDVSLIIKTFRNPHNKVTEWLEAARAEKENFPEVIVIEEDLADGQLKRLYEACDVLVAPSRAEGFGLPMAEAMLSGLPVITTGWGGQTDFCNNDTSWLVDYKFETAETHFGLFNSVWAAPDEADLARVMAKVFVTPPAQRLAKAHCGRKLLLEHFTWDKAAQRLDQAVRRFALAELPKTPHIGWVSTWNTPCGIASYSAHLVGNTDTKLTVFGSRNGPLINADTADIVRSWQSGGADSLVELSTSVDAANVDVVVVQFQYSFFDFDAFSRFLHRQSEAGRVVVVVMHATVDPVEHPHMALARLIPALAECDRILVHSPADMNRLKAYGLVDNVALFPHGVLDVATAPVKQPAEEFVISSYGFFLPHKGLDQLIDAMAILHAKGLKVFLKMVNAEYPVHVSHEMIVQAKEKITRLGLDSVITVISDYLADEDSLRHLADSDLIVFPYQGTGESSSAAVRYGLATGRPIAVTPLPIFGDVSKAVHYLPGISVEDIAKGIEELVVARDSGGHAGLAKSMAMAEKWREAHRYSALGLRLQNMLKQLASRRARTPVNFV
jgi:glycosyltransferase involved in cell wall biosynthesis